MIGSVGKSILKTLAYSDIFNYPLKKEEIRKFLIPEGVDPVYLKCFRLEEELRSLSSLINRKKEFYFLKNRDQIVKKRQEREKESVEKLLIAKKVMLLLSLIPTVQLLGISGGLAVKNSDKNDDIDLFVITKKNKLWATRLLIILFLKIIGKHRRRLSKDIKDKICLNFLMDETSISFPKKRQDLYNAHEVVQMMLVFERNNMYQKFIDANRWVDKFLPNALKQISKPDHTQNSIKFPFSVVLRSVLFGSVIEYFSKRFQLWYMKNHKKNELITDHVLAFHPVNNRKRVLSLYKKRLKQYKLL